MQQPTQPRTSIDLWAADRVSERDLATVIRQLAEENIERVVRESLTIPETVEERQIRRDRKHYENDKRSLMDTSLSMDEINKFYKHFLKLENTLPLSHLF